jgi:hypothetical protein
MKSNVRSNKQTVILERSGVRFVRPAQSKDLLLFFTPLISNETVFYVTNAQHAFCPMKCRSFAARRKTLF